MEHFAKAWLKSRHITIPDLADLAYTLKGMSSHDLDRLHSILDEIIEIPAVKDFILLSITLDVYAENHLLPEPLLERILDKESSFTLHDALSLSILSSFDPQVTEAYHGLLSSHSLILDQLMDDHMCNRFLKSLLAVILSMAIKAY